jgi:hypothetical protein
VIENECSALRLLFKQGTLFAATERNYITICSAEFLNSGGEVL